MNDELVREYKKIRRANAYYPARYAAELARWKLTAPAIDVAGDAPALLELEAREGFELSARVDNDYDYNVTDYLGTFTDDEFASDGTRNELNPAAWREGERITHRSVYAYIQLETGFRYADQFEWARSVGMARSVADDYARAQVREDVDRMGSDISAVWILVTASRAGIELGTASLGGIELSDNYNDDARWISETILELVSEATFQARAALERLCTAGLS
jgi:hypothetical protein